jgi:hypothetical protein
MFAFGSSWRRVLVASGLTLLPTGCLGGRAAAPRVLVKPAPETTADVPYWVRRTPSEKGKVCATGAVNPTFYQQDGRVYAAEAARNELARSVQVHISSIMYDSESTSGGDVRQYIVSEVTTAVQDGVVSGAEVLEYWYDDHGAVARKGMTYALACMSTDQSSAQLAEKLEALAAEHPEDGQRIEAVKKRAKAAFDELERMEERQRR